MREERSVDLPPSLLASEDEPPLPSLPPSAERNDPPARMPSVPVNAVPAPERGPCPADCLGRCPGRGRSGRTCRRVHVEQDVGCPAVQTYESCEAAGIKLQCELVVSPLRES